MLPQSLFDGDYFSLLGCDRSIRLDTPRLESTYHKLLLLVHPDRFAAAGARERRMALQATAHLNRAYQVLNDEAERAAYLLELEGVVSDGEKTVSDVSFLAEQMDLREQLQLCKQSSEPVTDLKKLDDCVNASVAKMVSRFESKYKEKRFLEAEVVVQKMQFLKKLKKEIKSGLRSIQGGAARD